MHHYHNGLSEKVSNKSDAKETMIDWLTTDESRIRRICVNMSGTRIALNNPRATKYVIDYFLELLTTIPPYM